MLTTPALHRRGRSRALLIATACLVLLLSGVVGAQPGPTAAAEPERSAADAVSEAVEVAFRSLLDRDPTPAENRAFVEHLESGGRPTDMTVLLAASPEGRLNLVRHYYGPYLDRAGDSEGIAYWAGRMTRGLAADRFQALVLGSDEAYRNAGGDDEAWVTSLYAHPLLLGRAPDQAGLGFWVAYLGDHGRAQVAQRFVTSAEAERSTGRHAWLRLFGEPPPPAAWRDATLLYRDLGHDLWLAQAVLLGQQLLQP